MSRKILIIEDTPKHIDDAKAFFAQLKGSGEVTDTEFLFEETCLKATSAVTSAPTPDGVITDIHFPVLAKHMVRREDDIAFTKPQPCGVAIMVICQSRGIPCVFNTAGYHHGIDNQWICALGREVGWPGIVDASQEMTGEAERKNWRGAWDALKEEMERKAKRKPL